MRAGACVRDPQAALGTGEELGWPLAVTPPQTPLPPDTDVSWPSLQLGRRAHGTRLVMLMVGRSRGHEQHTHLGTQEVRCFGEGSHHLPRKAHLPLVHHQCCYPGARAGRPHGGAGSCNHIQAVIGPSAPRAAPRPEPPPCPRAPLLCTPLTRAPKIKYHLVSRKTSVMPHCSPAGPQLAFCLPVTCHEVLQRRVKPRCGNAVYTAQKVPRLLVHGHVAAGHWQDQKLLWALQTPVGHGGTTGLVIACHRHRRQR